PGCATEDVMRNKRTEFDRSWVIQAKAALRCGFSSGEVHTGPRETGRFTDEGGRKSQRLRPSLSVNTLRAFRAATAGLALAAAPLAAQAPGEESAVIAPDCDRACLI